MSDDLPSAWGQTCPRSVRLAPNGLLVPAGTLQVLLRAGRPQDLIDTGFALEPSGARRRDRSSVGSPRAAAVLEKYRQQVAGYRILAQTALGDDLVGVLGHRIRVGGTVLVGGSGVGAEAIHLTRLGYRVTGFDALPEMLMAAGEAAREAGVAIEFVRARVARSISPAAIPTRST